MSGKKIIHRGVLVKQGGSKGGWKTWKSRYFVLDERGFSYFANADEFQAAMPALGSLPYSSAMSLVVRPGVEFLIVADRTVAVRADSMAAKEAWVAAFRELLTMMETDKKSKGERKEERIALEGTAAKTPTNPLLLALQFGVAFCLENQSAILKNAQAGMTPRTKEKTEKKKKKKKDKESAEARERRERERKEAKAIEAQDPAYELTFEADGGTCMGVQTPAHTILPSGNSFTIKLRAPRIFQTLRKQWGISTSDFVKAVCRDTLTEFSTNSKSGAMFLGTANRLFVLKSASKNEVLFLKKLAPHMSVYLQSNPNSLLSPLLGLFKITFKGTSKDFVGMLNVDRSGFEAIKAYDLKGSEFRRRAASDAIVGLDDNLRRVLYVEKKAHARLMTQLSNDVSFLAANDIMDYSLFVSVHDNALLPRDRDADSVLKPQETKKEQAKPAKTSKEQAKAAASGTAAFNVKLRPVGASKSKAASKEPEPILDPGVPLKPPEELVWPGKSGCGYAGVGENGLDTEVYFLGVIDMLQTYGAARAVQSTFQKLVTRKQISIVEPKTYAERFLKAIAAHIQPCALDLPDAQPGCLIM